MPRKNDNRPVGIWSDGTLQIGLWPASNGPALLVQRAADQVITRCVNHPDKVLMGLSPAERAATGKPCITAREFLTGWLGEAGDVAESVKATARQFLAIPTRVDGAALAA